MQSMEQTLYLNVNSISHSHDGATFTNMDRGQSKNCGLYYGHGIMVTYIDGFEYYWNDNYMYTYMEQFITGIVWLYSTLSTILLVWIIYLFTIREWLDWRRIKMGKSVYDFNMILRTNKIKNTIQKKNK